MFGKLVRLEGQLETTTAVIVGQQEEIDELKRMLLSHDEKHRHLKNEVDAARTNRHSELRDATVEVRKEIDEVRVWLRDSRKQLSDQTQTVNNRLAERIDENGSATKFNAKSIAAVSDQVQKLKREVTDSIAATLDLAKTTRDLLSELQVQVGKLRLERAETQAVDRGVLTSYVIDEVRRRLDDTHPACDPVMATPFCPHGNPAEECDDCMIASDFAHDANREQRF